MNLRLNFSQKLLIAISALVFAAGAAKFLYYRIAPLDALSASIRNLAGSAGFEQTAVIEIQLMHDSEWGTPASFLNGLSIVVNYKRNRNASKAEFALEASGEKESVLSGSVYANQDLTGLTLDGKSFHWKNEAHTAEPGLSEIKDKMRPYIKQGPAEWVVINDYARQEQFKVDNFYLKMDGDESIWPLKLMISFLEAYMPGISAHFPIPLDTCEGIEAWFQADGLMRLRNAQIELYFTGALASIDLGTPFIGSGIIAEDEIDFTNSLDISDVPEDEIGSLFKNAFEMPHGG